MQEGGLLNPYTQSLIFSYLQLGTEPIRNDN